MQLIKNYTSTNKTTYSPNRKIEWIVLHYTAGTKSTKGSASSTANYFKTSTAEASADFIVDDETAVQYNPDIKNRYTWAVGGSKYTTKSTSLAAQYYGKCTNKNSINIEMCSNKSKKNTLYAIETDWYFTDATFNNAVELVKLLMAEYNIDKNHVIMHHQVTGKVCPNPWCVNEDRLVIYKNFLNKLSTPKTVSPTPATASNIPTTVNETYKIKVIADVLNIRKGAGTNYDIVGTIKDKGIYTIVSTQNGWGLLKSYANNKSGWISLAYTKRV